MTLPYSGILKHKKIDFQVNEAYLIDQSLVTKDDHHLLVLKKCGFSTFDAVQMMSRHLAIPTNDITYYGLKDEDAITQQLLNLRGKKENLLPLIKQLNDLYAQKTDYLHLTYLNTSPHPLKVGELIGNHFLLTVRKLPKELAHAFRVKDTLRLLFLNYYGTQRFSLPNHPPSSHIIGEAILQQNDSLALDLIQRQQSNLGLRAREHQGSAADFFTTIDSREKNFFINAYYSHIWNNELKSALLRSEIKVHTYIEKSIDYLFASSNDLRHSIVPDMLMQKKVKPEDDNSIIQEHLRPTMLQIFFKVIAVSQDDCFDEFYKVQLKFTLPSGSYATVAIAQLLYEMERA